MTNKLKKRTPLIRRLISMVSVLAIFILSMPMAQAAEMTATLNYDTAYGTTNDGTMRYNGSSGSLNVPASTWQGTFGQPRSETYYGLYSITINSAENNYTGNVGVYLSYYVSGNATYWQSTNHIQQLTGQYTNHEGNQGTVRVDIDKFTPNVSNAVSAGHSVKVQFKGTEDLPISNLKIVTANSNLSNAISYSKLFNQGNYANIHFTSARVVTTEYSAELDAMESMADNIAQQNEMMQAMYGEIISLCNAILAKCGDLETAINLTNSYCSAMLDALGDIATTNDNIYQLLGTQFALLISTIQTESSNIQDAIANAEAKLEAYFDNAGMGAVGTLPDETEDIENKADGLIEDESAYESDASEQFADIVASFNGFSGGALNGVALATDLFTQIWNVLGEWKVVYTFPLIMGLVLLVIGRMSRFSGTMNSRNNGDKDVGGD